MKKALSAIVGILFLATIPLTYIAFHHHNKNTHFESQNSTTDQIKDGIKLYAKQSVDTYTINDYITLSKINQITNHIPKKTLDALAQKYENDPYKRLIDKNTFSQDITFTLQKDPEKKLDYYVVANVPISIHLYDSVFLKALYCDKTGYTDEDFEALDHLDHKGSDYLAVSYLYALLLLQENQCYDPKTLKAAIDESAQRLARTEDADTSFSDLYAERIVVLYWSGYGNLVQKAWIEKIRESYKPGVGWVGSSKIQTTNPPNGFSLLALLYYQENKPHQELY